MNKENIFNLIENNDINQVKKWLEFYPNNINFKNKYGETPLHDACWYGHLEIAKLLISKGANIKAKDNLGYTLLHDACDNDNHKIDVVKLLINKGVNIEAKDDVGETPLHKACYFDKLNIVKLLIQKGADVNCKNYHGNKPLDYLNDDNKKVINKYIRYIKLDSKIISLSQIQL